MNNNEEYLALFGKKVGGYYICRGYYPTEGHPTSVRFDADKIIEREKGKKDVMGFYHTHPHMTNLFSWTDMQTMEGWTDMFGKALYCLIRGENGLVAWKSETVIFPDGKGYMFQMSPRKAWQVGNTFIFGE